MEMDLSVLLPTGVENVLQNGVNVRVELLAGHDELNADLLTAEVRLGFQVNVEADDQLIDLLSKQVVVEPVASAFAHHELKLGHPGVGFVEKKSW